MSVACSRVGTDTLPGGPHAVPDAWSTPKSPCPIGRGRGSRGPGGGGGGALRRDAGVEGVSHRQAVDEVRAHEGGDVRPWGVRKA